MGSIGAAHTTVNTNTFVGKSVDDLFKAAESRQTLRDTFDLQNASNNQIDTLNRIIRGIQQYDKGYDDNKTPYNILRITVNEMGTSKTPEEIEADRRLGIRQTKNPIYVNIDTVPNVDNALIRMMDEKSHNAIIGPNGGLYTYDDKGKKKSLDLFKVQYGERSGI